MTSEFLKVGQKFRLKLKKKKVVATVESFTDKPARKNTDNLTIASYNSEVHTRWTETKKARSGPAWTREHKEVTSDSVGAHVLTFVWEVEWAHMGGGGTGHGPHDVYPDGWLVTAHDVERPKRKLHFSQSGCFTHQIDAEEIEVVR